MKLFLHKLFVIKSTTQNDDRWKADKTPHFVHTKFLLKRIMKTLSIFLLRERIQNKRENHMFFH